MSPESGAAAGGAGLASGPTAGATTQRQQKEQRWTPWPVAAASVVASCSTVEDLCR